MNNIDTRVRLSTMWIVVMINMIFADIFSIIVEIVHKSSFNDIPGEVKTVMAIAAIVTNIPIMMIYFSRTLSYKINRITNIIVAILTIIYVVGGAALTPHYFIIAAIEVIFMIMIIIYAAKWKNEE